MSIDSPSPLQCLVLDTNVVLDWLVFRDARVEPLATALATGTLQVLGTPAMRLELAQMLASARLARWSPDAGAVLAAYDAQVTLLPAGATALPAQRPRCTDPDDQMFVDLALAAQAPWLLTHDRALLRLARRLAVLGVRVGTPMAWAASQAMATA